MTVEVEYIESGTFVGGEEDCFTAGIRSGDTCYVSRENPTEEIERLRAALHDIHTTAHCIAKAGPLNTPTLQEAWTQFMHISAMATGGLARTKDSQ